MDTTRRTQQWNIEFEESMLNGKVIVLCETEKDASDLMEILLGMGVRWNDNTLPDPDDTYFGEYVSGTCYFIEGHHMAFDSVNEAEQSEYNGYIRCKFHSACTDFEIANEHDFLALIGVE